MGTLAELIWNPFLSLIYLEVGLLFLVLTGGVALRRGGWMLRQIWQAKPEASQGEELSHRHAFLSALAAVVGVGNVAGVGTAIHLGGPGAMFWLWVSALLGSSFRMTSTFMSLHAMSAGQDPRLFATPMSYLERYLPRAWRWVPMVLAGLLLCKGLVTANLVQANSLAHSIARDTTVSHLVVAVILAALVALVILGGLQSIVRFSAVIAPWMIGVYLAMGLFILLSQPGVTLEAFGLILHHAFQPYSLAGGVAGYSVMTAIQFGISRGVFSHGSGIGVAPFLQAANVDHPARGALMAGVIPLIDSLVICSITGLVVLSEGHWHEETGAFLSVGAYQSALGPMGRILVITALAVFAFTTIIAWAHFAERCFTYLGGRRVRTFRWFFVGVTFAGPFFPVALVWSMGDVLIALLLLCHLLPLSYILIRKLPEVRRILGEALP
ncbi:MAG: sodium:alanine symporter family protein [Magnetococcales bacterium]|nr:sodium:alanine symporter family protein [Magnetococcales bacterium]